MIVITEELKKMPRHIVVDLVNNTWWEIGIDGQSYATDAAPTIFKKIKGRKETKGSFYVESVEYYFVKV